MNAVWLMWTAVEKSIVSNCTKYPDRRVKQCYVADESVVFLWKKVQR